MKKSVLILSVVLFGVLMFSCTPKTDTEAQNVQISDTGAAVIQFKHTEFDFGEVMEGEKVTHTYQFVNTGGKALVIKSASASCGCTAPSFTKEPVPSGGEGFVEVMFNTHGRTGHQSKTVTISTNASEERVVLKFTAEVKPMEAE
jgi:hypothetical protein